MTRIFHPESFYYKRLPNDAPIDPKSQSVVSAFVAEVKEKKMHWNYETFAPVTWYARSNTPKGKIWLDKADGTETSIRTMLESVPLPFGMRCSAPYPTAEEPKGGDDQVAIYNVDTDEYWDIHGLRYLPRPDAPRTAELVPSCSTLEEPGWHCNFASYMPHASQTEGQFAKAEGAIGPGTSGSGLAVAGFTITAAEAERKFIPHAIRLAIKNRGAGFRWPATSTDSAEEGSVDEGMIFRFPAGIDLSVVSDPFMRAVAVAIRDHGMVMTDGGSQPISFLETRSTRPYSQVKHRNPWLGPKNELGGPEAILTASPEALWEQLPLSQLQVLDESYRP